MPGMYQMVPSDTSWDRPHYNLSTETSTVVSFLRVPLYFTTPLQHHSHHQWNIDKCQERSPTTKVWHLMWSRSPILPPVRQKPPRGSGLVTIPLAKISLPPAPVENVNLPRDCWSPLNLVIISFIILSFIHNSRRWFFIARNIYTK
jgi:hypothetical protein